MALNTFLPNTIIESAKLNANFEGLADGTEIADGAIDSTKIDFGGSGAGIWWEEIARTTLTVAGDTISVQNIPARKYLKVLCMGIATGGTLDTSMRFDNNSSTVYAFKQSTNEATATDLASTTNITLESGATDSGQLNTGSIEIWNIAGQEKNYRTMFISQDAAGGATVPTIISNYGKFAVTSGQISRIDWINAGTGDFEIGSEVIVLGHD
jgi:hypothetical protein